MTAPEPQGSVEPLLTPADVAEILRISLRSVRRLFAKKKLRVVHIGRAVRVRASDLRAYIEALAEQSTGSKEKPTVDGE